jgi:tetratricopeptide (TPR) repeat protein
VAETVPFKYRAFLSYSHRDTAWGKWLHAALEGYRLDKDLVGRQTPAGPVPKTLRPIFRDREDFSAGHSLTEQTLAALEASQFLIVLCSPNAAKSQYVNEEIRRFKTFGRADRVIPVIVDGEPGDPARECFPPALRFRLALDGTLTDEREEPIAADARTEGDGKDIVKQKVVAGLLGLGLDEIVRRAERARRRSLRNWAGGLALLTIVFAVLAVWAEINRRDAVAARLLAEQQQHQAEQNFLVAKRAADSLVFDLVQGLRNVEGMRTETLRKILGRAEEAYGRLVQNSGNDLNLLRSQAVMYNEFADTYAAQGDTAKQLASARASLDIMKRLVEASPGWMGWQGDLSVSYNKVGDALKALGNLPEALTAYRGSLAIRERLAKIDAGNDGWQRDLAISYDNVGNVLLTQDNLAEALSAYRSGFAIFERLAQAKPGNAGWQRDLALSHDNIGDVLVAQGNLPESLKAYRDSLAIRERLAAADPGNTLWQNDLAALYDRIGKALKAQGNLAEALKAYSASLDIIQRLAQSDPGNADWQQNLSISYEQVGDILQAQGNSQDAVKAFRACLAIRERLAAADPTNVSMQVNVLVMHWRLAENGDDPSHRWPFIVASLRKLKQDNKLPSEYTRMLPEAEARLAKLQAEQNTPARRTR